MTVVVGEPEAIDRTDREILRILRDDARIPWQALAGRVHLSANATADRVRRLTRRGVIRLRPSIVMLFIAMVLPVFSAAMKRSCSPSFSRGRKA